MMDKDTMLQDNDTLIVHLCPRGAWEAALVSGAFHTTSLDEEGFIHCSRRNQILAVANTLYQDISDAVLLWIDPVRVMAEIRWELVGDDSYPHIYGELNIDAVIEVSDLNREM